MTQGIRHADLRAALVTEFARTPRIAVDIDLPPTLDRLKRRLRTAPRIVRGPRNDDRDTETEEGTAVIDFSLLGRVRFEFAEGGGISHVLYECDDCGAIVRQTLLAVHRASHPDPYAGEDDSDLTEAQKTIRVGDTVSWRHEGFGTNTGTVVNADSRSLRINGLDSGSWNVARSDVVNINPK